MVKTNKKIMGCRSVRMLGSDGAGAGSPMKNLQFFNHLKFYELFSGVRESSQKAYFLKTYFLSYPVLELTNQCDFCIEKNYIVSSGLSRDMRKSIFPKSILFEMIPGPLGGQDLYFRYVPQTKILNFNYSLTFFSLHLTLALLSLDYMYTVRKNVMQKE